LPGSPRERLAPNGHTGVGCFEIGIPDEVARVERRLAAIMFADIVGYTALMAQDEAKGLRVRERHRALVRPLVEKYHGEAIEARGDESLAVFPTALDAVNCAFALEEALAGDRELRLHIGIHLGDFVVAGGEVSGDAVNIAARTRSFAESGVCVTGEVYHSVRNQPNVEGRPLGEHDLKNVGRPVALFAIRGKAAAPSVVAARAAGPRRIRSLAVLPLENLSGDPNQEYFADGMTETLIGDLGKLRALRVISRTSVMRYKGARKPLPEIAAELGVDALLEGTVIRDGERVRITTQLIDGRTDHHIWSERYDRELRGILELQSDVARAVARKIELELSPGEAARLTDRRSLDPAAHDDLLRGIYHFGRFTPESMRSALTFFERAIELDSDYAEAHYWLGAAWCSLATGLAAVPALEGMPKAKAAVLRALELDDTQGQAHAGLGWVAFTFDWDWEASERHFRRALELSPSLLFASNGYPYQLVTRGRHEEAIAEARRAAALAPLDPLTRAMLVEVNLLARRYDDALAENRRIFEIDPTHRFAYRDLARTCEALGRYDEAIDAWERFGLPSEIASASRSALSREGAKGYLREALRLLRAVPGTRRTTLAVVYARLRERDEAFAELERAYASREGGLVFLRVEPGWDPIRDDPRFDDLVRRIGIPEG
jgi:TolB-like protein/Flp pilus assembly protein TadD